MKACIPMAVTGCGRGHTTTDNTSQQQSVTHLVVLMGVSVCGVITFALHMALA